jgi:hypothetical protein
VDSTTVQHGKRRRIAKEEKQMRPIGTPEETARSPTRSHKKEAFSELSEKLCPLVLGPSSETKYLY